MKSACAVQRDIGSSIAAVRVHDVGQKTLVAVEASGGSAGRSRLAISSARTLETRSSF